MASCRLKTLLDERATAVSPDRRCLSSAYFGRVGSCTGPTFGKLADTGERVVYADSWLVPVTRKCVLFLCAVTVPIPSKGGTRARSWDTQCFREFEHNRSRPCFCGFVSFHDDLKQSRPFSSCVVPQDNFRRAVIEYTQSTQLELRVWL